MKKIILISIILMLVSILGLAQKRQKGTNKATNNETKQEAQNPRQKANAKEDLTKPGRHDISIQVDGVTRWFILYVPKTYNSSKPSSVVFAFHGGNGGMINFFQSRGDLVSLSESKNFLLVAPNGQNGKDNLGSSFWNAVHCCGIELENRVSDVEFVEAMIDKLKKNLSVDAKRIHAVGFSNGGMLVHRLAAEIPDVLASVATMCGTIGGHNLPSKEDIFPTSKAPIPMLMMHGTSDTRVNYNGGFCDESPQRYDVAFSTTVSFWVKANSCNQKPSTDNIRGRKGNIRVETYSGCKNTADTVAMSLENVKHGWLDKQFAGFDGTTESINFFEKHPKR